MKTSYTVFLVSGMLLTGTLNTLLTKLQDLQCVGNCDDPDPKRRRLFEQPTWQTLNMFAGETMCLIVLYINILWTNYRLKRRGYRELMTASLGSTDDDNVIEPAALDIPGAVAPTRSAESSLETDSLLPSTLDDTRPLVGRRKFLMWIPALCDICGTTLMNVGLFYISASVYQMMRGAVVIFSGIMSVIFLKHRLQRFQWAALMLIMLGVGIVGMSSVLFPYRPPVLDDGVGGGPAPDEPSLFAAVASSAMEFSERSLLGVLMILTAQIFTAAQFVVEEKIMLRYHVVPMRAVGLEGIFGFVTTAVGIPLLHLAVGRSHPGGYFDMVNGFYEVINNPGVWSTSIAIMFSIAFFNWFGLSVTRTISATSRSTIDTCRTLFIWMSSLALGWEHFQPLQVLGFLVLIYGTFLYNGVVSPPWGAGIDKSVEELTADGSGRRLVDDE
ncbi:hypothetical protein IWQ60_009397 [Tieghemiomyces parasiticus]|uniref:Integral membrane protein n=1 Tax=Tieghemiomyces parasiticus TaxID=78921 RepID=A0A9W7ZXU4_9FUNG|nr:hypothetical protein IWQ60_009397 [Tieghemiomyces parasiticus]